MPVSPGSITLANDIIVSRFADKSAAQTYGCVGEKKLGRDVHTSLVELTKRYS